MNRSFQFGPLLLTALVALCGLASACESETGPDAPPRTGNGCIDTDCQVSSSSGGSGNSSGSTSSGSSDAGGDAK